ncbi:MAG: hypothetical protein JSW51_04075 [Gemmatimonadota bacterium]|nr:MAG: hypothetical protein JSW51_04075 [Gemmatimonadota bacterium]
MKYSRREENVFRLVHLLPVGLVLAIASCSDGTGPPADVRPQDGLGTIIGPGVADVGLQVLRHNVKVVTPGGEPLFHVMSASSVGGPSLETYQLSFWAVRGTAAEVHINYLSDDQQSGEFLTFRVPSGALERKPDGSTIAWGDSVQITLSVDPNTLLVRFQPSGLVFSAMEPAQLEMWYGATEGDLDNDGDVDPDDTSIQQARLGIYYQQESGDLWYPISSMHDTGQEWFKTHLFHFSGYAVSWEK